MTHSRTIRAPRVLTNDPAMGVFRHVSAGYDAARECADGMCR